MDREKVIKGLETCIPMKYETSEEKECRHEQCPYGRENYKPMNGCFWDLMSDSLELLKEQEYKDKMFHALEDDWKRLNELLKEQDAVEPKYNVRTNWYECGACHYSMTSGMHCRGELIPAYKVGFCAKCGKGVMWK